jgi:hypothetical protein
VAKTVSLRLSMALHHQLPVDPSIPVFQSNSKGRDVPATGFDQIPDPVLGIDLIIVLVRSAVSAASDLNQMDIVDDDGSDTDHTALTDAIRKAFRLYIPIPFSVRALSPSLLSRPSSEIIPTKTCLPESRP